MKGMTTSFTDIPADHWTLRMVPAPWRPYVRLMRLDRPIGTWLLLFPCWWSLCLASPSLNGNTLFYAILFAIGAVVMRGAGCTVNDIADRDFDAQVERTRNRPIASNQISRKQAAIFLMALLLVGLVVLLQFPSFAVWVGIASLFLVFPYPLMKRITGWPQAWLGLTFNWGALLGWAAVKEEIQAPALLLYGAGLFWTLGYDTVYAHQDKDDDEMVGVKSTALTLGTATTQWMWGFYGLTLAGLIGAGLLVGLAWPFYPMMILAGLHLVWQITTVEIDDPDRCLMIFRSNRWFGWLVLAAILLGKSG
jgi:4-hydroxybenzoate polyprenyltransferase